MNESTTEIPDWIKQILLEEARGIYGEFVMTCGITVEERTSNILPNPHVKRTFSTKISTNKVKMLELRDDRIDSVDYVNIDKNQNSVQSQVARRLREIYGLATYKSWFSKLNIVDTDVEVDTIEAKTKTEVKIQTQTRFVRDWVRINYGTVIEQVLKGFLPNLQYVEFV